MSEADSTDGLVVTETASWNTGVWIELPSRTASTVQIVKCGVKTAD